MRWLPGERVRARSDSKPDQQASTYETDSCQEGPRRDAVHRVRLLSREVDYFFERDGLLGGVSAICTSMVSKT